MENIEISKQIAKFMGTPFRKPTHGTCCSCQVCGHYFDDCQCDYATDIEMTIKVLHKLNKDGGCYSLINDDFGNWACVSDGIQPAEEKFEGGTTFFIDDIGLWADTIEMAICLAAIETTKD